MKKLFTADPIRKKCIFTLKDKIVWCGCIVQDDEGLYHLYFSGWDAREKFTAWVTHSQAGHAVSKNPGGPFVFRSWCLTGSGVPGEWDADVIHNPTVIRTNGKYYLYYTGNYSLEKELWDHRNHQQIGVAWSDSPDGPFRRSGHPVIKHPGAVMTSNPSVCQIPDGRYLLIYKWVEKKNPAPFYGPVHVGSAFAGSPEGPFIPQDPDLLRIRNCAFPAEDPFVFCRNGQIFCLVKDNLKYCSPYSKALVLYQSSDALHWKCLGPALGRTLMTEFDGLRRFFRMERPSLLFDRNGETRLSCAVKTYASGDDTFLFNTVIYTGLW